MKLVISIEHNIGSNVSLTYLSKDVILKFVGLGCDSD